MRPKGQLGRDLHSVNESGPAAVALNWCVLPQVDGEKPEEVRLIDLDESHSGEHTVFIMPPEIPQEADGSDCPALYRCVAAFKLGSFLCASKKIFVSPAMKRFPR